MRVRIAPTPAPGTAAAIRRALAAADGAVGQHPAYRSRWRRAGLDYATARPRSSRGATRA